MENENQSPSPVESIDQPLQLSHAAGNLQMACIFQPDPNPIRVSPKVGNPTVRDLRVILSRRRMADPVYLSRITITIPVGDDTGPRAVGRTITSTEARDTGRLECDDNRQPYRHHQVGNGRFSVDLQ